MAVQYMVDETGKKTGVLLSIEEYEELLEKIEDTEAIKMLRKMKKTPAKTRSFDDFVNKLKS
jgi:hypothetical protein